MSEARRASWSIAERATGWFAATTALVVLLISGYAASEVHRSMQAALDALALEKMNQLRSRFEPAEQLESAAHAGRRFAERREHFEQLVTALRAEAPENALAFRVWDATTGEHLGDFGALELFELAEPDSRPSDGAVRLPEHLLARTERFTSDIQVALLLSGLPQQRAWQRFLVVSLALALVSGFCAYLSGKYFIRKACGYMHELALRTRAVRDSTESVAIEPGEVPDEIAELVQALGTMLQNIRSEQDRTRLMTAGLAHELGSPLQNLIGETEVALMGRTDAEEYRRVLKSHLEELRDIGHAIGNLMTLVSLGQKTEQSLSEPFDLGAEAKVRLRRERLHAERFGTALEVRESGELTLHGDREALWLVVSNLVANAIDYTPHGGRVRLEMRGGEQGVQLCVDDSGPGIPQDQRAKIFEPFYRGPTTRGRRAGYGLGLSIVKSAVEAQGGSITVESSELGGARFVVELPRRRKPLEQPAA